MTVAVIWILIQMQAPWWTYVAAIGMFFVKALLCVAAFDDKNGK